jgi:hypothetical protein
MNHSTGVKTGWPIIFYGILFCALVLRLYNLYDFDLWFDELGTEMFSARSLERMTDLSAGDRFRLMLDWMKRDPHSPVYYILIHGFSLWGGDGPALRIPSVIFSMLALVIFYKVARLFFDQPTSLMSLLILAFNPFHIWYAQEARVYAMASFVLLSAFYALMRAIMTDRVPYWACFVISGIVTMLSIYNSVFFFIMTGAVFFIKKYRYSFCRWSIALAMMFGILWLGQFILMAQLGFVKNHFWVPKPTMEIFFYTWHFFTIGYSATPWQCWMAGGLYFVLCVYGAYVYGRRDREKMLYLLWLLFIPLTVTFIFSKLFFSIYLYRQVLIYSPFYYLFVAQGIQSIRRASLRTIIIIFIFGLMLVSLSQYYRGYMLYEGTQPRLTAGIAPKKNYSGLIKQVLQDYQTGDFIAAADLEAYVIARSVVARNFEQYHQPPFRIFAYVFLPRDLHSFERHFLGVHDLLENIPANEEEEIYQLALMSNGAMQLKKFDAQEARFKRIWVIASHGLHSEPDEISYMSVRDYLWHFYKSKIFASKEGLQIELFEEISSSHEQGGRHG